MADTSPHIPPVPPEILEKILAYAVAQQLDNIIAGNLRIPSVCCSSTRSEQACKEEFNILFDEWKRGRVLTEARQKEYRTVESLLGASKRIRCITLKILSVAFGYCLDEDGIGR